MKKIGVIVLGIMMFLVLYSGWKANYDIRVISNSAYNWLDDNNKALVIDKKPVEIKEISFSDEYLIFNGSETTDINGMEVYRVTFKSDKEELLGPIVVYLGRENLKVLGMDYRE